MKKMTNRKGFTLLEVVVVVAIITILASATYISVTNYVKHANEQAQIAALRGSEQDRARRSVQAILGNINAPAENNSGGDGGSNPNPPVPITPDQPAEPATPADPGSPGEPATPADPATPANPTATPDPTSAPTSAPTSVPTSAPTPTVEEPSDGYDFDPSIGRPSTGRLVTNDGGTTNAAGASSSAWGNIIWGTSNTTGGGGVAFESGARSFVVYFTEDVDITGSTMTMEQIGENAYRVTSSHGKIWYWGVSYTSTDGTLLDSSDIVVVEYTR